MFWWKDGARTLGSWSAASVSELFGPQDPVFDALSFEHSRLEAGSLGPPELPYESAQSTSQLPKANRPFDLLVFQFWPIFSKGPKR